MQSRRMADKNKVVEGFDEMSFDEDLVKGKYDFDEGNFQVDEPL